MGNVNCGGEGSQLENKITEYIWAKREVPGVHLQIMDYSKNLCNFIVTNQTDQKLDLTYRADCFGMSVK